MTFNINVVLNPNSNTIQRTTRGWIEVATRGDDDSPINTSLWVVKPSKGAVKLAAVVRR